MRWAAAGCLALFLTACATTAKPPATSASPAKPSALPAQPTTAAPARPAAPPVATPATGGAQTPTTPPERSAAGREAAQPEIKPYERVITKDAKSDEGIFTVHRIKEKVFYEIPKKELGKDFLWVTQIARTTLGVGYGGQAVGNRVVRWERNDNRVLLRGVLYDVVADRPDTHDEGRRGGQQRRDHHGVQHRGARQGRGAGHRRVAAVHDRGARVQRANAAARPRLRRRPLVRRAHGVVPREHRGGGDPHLHGAADLHRRRCRRPRRRARWEARRCAPAAPRS